MKQSPVLSKYYDKIGGCFVSFRHFFQHVFAIMTTFATMAAAGCLLEPVLREAVIVEHGE